MMIIFNILLGFSLGLIFGSITIRKNVFHGPNSLEVQKKIYKKNRICYRFTPKVVNCDSF